MALNIHKIETARDMRRTVFTLVWPVIVQNSLITFMFFADTLMVSWLGEIPLSAVGIVGPLLWSTSMILMAIGVGTMATVARAVGERDTLKAQATAATGLSLSLISGFIISAAGVIFAEPLIRLFMNQLEVVLEGKFYLITIASAFVLFFPGAVASNIIRASGDTRTPMIVGILANIFNIVANYALIFGKLGMPEMGLAGAGLATALARTLEGSLLLSHLFSSHSAVRLSIGSFLKITKKTLWTVVRISLPAGVEPLFVHSGFLVFTKVVALLGTAAVAAHRIAIGIESLGFMAGDAFYAVTATIVGQSLGACRKDLAQMGTKESMKAGLVVMSGAGLIFLLLPRPLVQMFTNDPRLIDLAVVCLLIGAAEQPFMLAADVFKGTFQGAGETKTPAIVGALSVWLTRVPLSYLLAVKLQLGLAGIWLTTVLDWIVRTSIFFLIYRRGRWKETKV